MATTSPPPSPPPAGNLSSSGLEKLRSHPETKGIAQEQNGEPAQLPQSEDSSLSHSSTDDDEKRTKKPHGEFEYELPENADWRSFDWLEVPDIVYKLDISRKKGDNQTDSYAHDGCYIQDKPFSSHVHHIDREVQQKPTAPQEEYQSGPVLEVVQRAQDSRFTHITKPQDLRLSDLQISKLRETDVVIHSRPLRKALRSLVKYYPDYPDYKFLEPVVVSKPYAFLIHHFRGMEDFLAPSSNDSTDKSQDSLQANHMRLLRDFLSSQFHASVVPTDVRLKEATPTIEFDKLWYLFRPGLDVYVQSTEDIHACVISNLSRSFRRRNQEKQWKLEMWYLGTDGQRIARIRKSVRISGYSGWREVKSLPVCPVAMWDSFDGGKRHKSMMERSELFMQTLRTGSMHATYDGIDHVDRRRFKGNVVVDCIRGWSTGYELGEPPPIGEVKDSHNTYKAYDYIYIKKEDLLVGESEGVEYNEGDDDDEAEEDDYESMSPSTERRVRFELNNDDSDEYPTDGRRNRTSQGVDALAKARYGTSEITAHQLLLLYPQAPAFALSTKQWMLVSLDRLKPVESSSESIDNLVLVDNNALQTIRALSVRQNSRQKAWSADFIEGKGSGQIILLHGELALMHHQPSWFLLTCKLGPPGVGKTFTVESIAAWLQRPLLALTVADIGTVETKIEQELMKWFDLAESWNAVLLVDEADIFLEQRKTRDLARNGLVSAFLRRMEYFKGLLFLTTNRVGQIDDAFMSRVHVAIGYEQLTLQVRQDIWRGFFKKVAVERAGKLIIGPNAKKFILEDPMVQKIELNGRDIRNALQTAITLAEYETLEGLNSEENELVIVEEGHFRRVLQMGEKFQRYITSIRREDEAKRANQRGDRNDYTDDS